MARAKRSPGGYVSHRELAEPANPNGVLPKGSLNFCTRHSSARINHWPTASKVLVGLLTRPTQTQQGVGIPVAPSHFALDAITVRDFSVLLPT